MPLPLFIVDAFTARPFAGNPAAICLLDSSRPDDWMQALAAEMNLSETAFLLPEGEDWRLRWFTPMAEVDLCGHATLASAHVLWSIIGRGPGELHNPWAVVRDRRGRLHVLDTNNHRVQRVTP